MTLTHKSHKASPLKRWATSCPFFPNSSTLSIRLNTRVSSFVGISGISINLSLFKKKHVLLNVQLSELAENMNSWKKIIVCLQIEQEAVRIGLVTFTSFGLTEIYLNSRNGETIIENLGWAIRFFEDDSGSANMASPLSESGVNPGQGGLSLHSTFWPSKILLFHFVIAIQNVWLVLHSGKWRERIRILRLDWELSAHNISMLPTRQGTEPVCERWVRTHIFLPWSHFASNGEPRIQHSWRMIKWLRTWLSVKTPWNHSSQVAGK